MSTDEEPAEGAQSDGTDSEADAGAEAIGEEAVGVDAGSESSGDGTGSGSGESDEGGLGVLERVLGFIGLPFVVGDLVSVFYLSQQSFAGALELLAVLLAVVSVVVLFLQFLRIDNVDWRLVPVSALLFGVWAGLAVPL